MMVVPRPFSILFPVRVALNERCRVILAKPRRTDRKAEQNAGLWNQIQQAVGVVTTAGDLDYMELSIAAKAYYVLNKLNGKATLEDIAGMLPKFGWTVSDKQLERATDFVAKADLITKS